MVQKVQDMMLAEVQGWCRGCRGGAGAVQVVQLDLCFPFPRIMFDGVPVKRKKAVKLVGYTFDELGAHLE